MNEIFCDKKNIFALLQMEDNVSFDVGVMLLLDSPNINLLGIILKHSKSYNNESKSDILKLIEDRKVNVLIIEEEIILEEEIIKFMKNIFFENSDITIINLISDTKILNIVLDEIKYPDSKIHSPEEKQIYKMKDSPNKICLGVYADKEKEKKIVIFLYNDAKTSNGMYINIQDVKYDNFSIRTINFHERYNFVKIKKFYENIAKYYSNKIIKNQLLTRIIQKWIIFLKKNKKMLVYLYEPLLILTATCGHIKEDFMTLFMKNIRDILNKLIDPSVKILTNSDGNMLHIVDKLNADEIIERIRNCEKQIKIKYLKFPLDEDLNISRINNYLLNYVYAGTDKIQLFYKSNKISAVMSDK